MNKHPIIIQRWAPLAAIILGLGVVRAPAQPAQQDAPSTRSVRVAARLSDQPVTSSTLPVETLAPGNGDQGEGLRFNFKDVPLDTVLDYLARAAGFVIVRETQVEGRVDVVSHRALNRQEAVLLLNTVLSQKGYAAIQVENTLKIVTLEEARKRDIPVKVGAQPEQIPKSDQMVTQVIPVHYTKAADLINNLQPLMPSYANVSANESSNAVVLTATQTDVHRMVEIIAALDTSITATSTIKVYILQYSDATELAKLVTDLYKVQNSASSSSNAQQNGRRGFPMMPFGGPGEGGNNTSNSGSDARLSAAQVTAVADTRTNAVVVSAPEDVLPSITELIKQVDVSSTEIREIQVFTLQYADAETMADLINDVYNDDSSSNSSSSNRNSSQSNMARRFMGGMGMPGMPGMPGMMMGGSGSSSGSSTRSSEESTVLAAADVRTNSVVVNASKDMMTQIGPMIENLDKNPAKDRKVHVYTLKYADPEQVAILLDNMFGPNSSNASSLSSSTTQGGVFDETSSSNSSSSSSRSSGSSAPSGLGSN